MDDLTLDLISPVNYGTKSTEEAMIDQMIKEVDAENEEERVEAGLPCYKLAQYV